MNNRTTLLLCLIVGLSGGMILSRMNIIWTIDVLVILLILIPLIVFFDYFIKTDKGKQDYETLAQTLFFEVAGDLEAIRRETRFVDDAQLREQLDLICEDTAVLLYKITEKMPETRLTTGKFVRGNLDFIISDILPQYIEMQEAPRYYDTPGQLMIEGQEAIASYAKFLHAQIVKLEIPDEIRYAVATEMLKSLNAYLHVETLPSETQHQIQ